MKVVRLSALCIGRFYPPRKYPRYLFLLQAESTPRSWCGRKDYFNEKFQITPSEIKPATFQLVAQCLKPTAPPAACPPAVSKLYTKFPFPYWRFTTVSARTHDWISRVCVPVDWSSSRLGQHEGDSFSDVLPVCLGWKFDHSSHRAPDAPGKQGIIHFKSGELN
jgi:hypothetical protein